MKLNTKNSIDVCGVISITVFTLAESRLKSETEKVTMHANDNVTKLISALRLAD